MLRNVIEITLRHGCSPVNLLHIFRNLFLRAPLDGWFCNLFSLVIIFVLSKNFTRFHVAFYLETFAFELRI